MKLLSSIIEIITSPFSVALRNSGNGKNYLITFAKVGFVLLVSALIVTALVLYYYREIIFNH